MMMDCRLAFLLALVSSSLVSANDVFRSTAELKYAVEEWDRNSGSARAKYGDINDWDVSQVDNFEGLFKDVSGSFDGSLNGWETSGVTSMFETFANIDFNPKGVQDWQVSRVQNLKRMFDGSTEFNRDLSKSMFRGATDFNADLSKWDLSSATFIGNMFQGAKTFNSNALRNLFRDSGMKSKSFSSWDVRSVTRMDNIFAETQITARKLCGAAWRESAAEDKPPNIVSRREGCGDDIPEGKKCSDSGNACNDEGTCGQGKLCPGGIGVELLCPAGTFGTGGGQCGGRCPAGKYSRLLGAPNKQGCEGVRCSGVAYYCPEGSASPIKVSNNHYTTPELDPETERTGQTPCGEGEFCVGGVRSAFQPGFYLDDNRERQVCPLGSYCTNNNRNDCSLGSYCDVGSSADLPCPATFYCTDAKTKNRCRGGQYCPSGSTLPRACPAGKTGINEIGYSLCAACEPGKSRSSDESINAVRAPENLLRCLDCKVGERSSDDGTACEACEDGITFQDQAQASFCKPCTKCAPGSRVSRACARDQNAKCKECPPGYYSSGIDQLAKCTKCDGPGEYAPKAGSTFCTVAKAGFKPNEARTDIEPCPKNTFSLGASDTCSKCSSGLSSEGSATCEACKAGTFLNNSTQQPECTPCPPGEISKAASQTCTKCKNGTWESNRIDCFACVAGRYGSEEGLANSSCSGTCPPGKHSYRYATKCLDCEPGKHAPNASMEECILCDKGEGFTSLASATECVCEEGKLLNPDGDCELCNEGMECTSIGVNVGNLALNGGFWRQDTETTNVIRCPFPKACAGENNACAEGNEDVLCAVCSVGYYRPNKLSACQKCDSSKAAAYGTLVVGIVAIAACVWLILLLNRHMPNALLRPFISLAQNLSIILLFDAPFPKSLVDLFAVIGNLDLGLELVWPSCIIEYDYYSSLLVLSFVSIAILVGLSFPILYVKVSERISWTDAASMPMGKRAIKDCFVVMLLVYPGLSGKSMQYFRCQDVEGKWYLVADFSVQCYDSTWWGLVPVALVLLFGFALGIPIAIFAMLYRNRHHLYDPVTKRANEQPLNVLCRPYRPGAWYFESVSMLFKVGLWCALVYFPSGSVGQFLVACTLNVGMLCVTVAVLPMGSRDARVLNAVQIVMAVILTSLSIGGLAMNALETAEMLAEIDDTAGKDTEYYQSMIVSIRTILEVFTITLMASIGLYILVRVYRKLPLNSRATRWIDALLGISSTSSHDQRAGGTAPTGEEGDVEMSTNPIHPGNTLCGTLPGPGQ